MLATRGGGGAEGFERGRALVHGSVTADIKAQHVAVALHCLTNQRNMAQRPGQLRKLAQFSKRPATG
eukprot:9444991-Pyramimonas_sp.AAC.1